MKEDTKIQVSSNERKYLVGELHLMGYDIVARRPRNKDYQVIVLYTDTDEFRDSPLYIRTGYDLRTEVTTVIVEGLLANARAIPEGHGVSVIASDIPRKSSTVRHGERNRDRVRQRQKPRT